MPVQSILFERYKNNGKKYWSTLHARRWLKSHGFVYDQFVDKKPGVLRFRQYNPKPMARYSTKKLGDGIMLVIDH